MVYRVRIVYASGEVVARALANVFPFTGIVSLFLQDLADTFRVSVVNGARVTELLTFRAKNPSRVQEAPHV